MQMQATSLKGFNLSLQQARLWSLQGESQAYRVQCSIRLQGTLDVTRFLHALQCLLNRHAILRTGFYCLPGMDVPLQVITDQVRVNCVMIDLDHLSLLIQAAQLDICFTMLRNETFDLKHSSLIHAWFIRLSMDEHILLINLPALCADDKTLTVCITELARAYRAGLHSNSFIEEPLQYVDVSAWQDELLLEDDAERRQQYWHRLDLSHLATMRLPFDRSNGSRGSRSLAPRETFAPAVLKVPVEDMLSSQIQAVAHRYQLSITAWLVACWQALLLRLTDEVDLVIGVACDGRIDEELANALGLYTRFVPMRALFADDLPFEQAAALIHTSLEEAFEEQLYFTWADNAAAENATAPLFFPVSFTYDAWPASFDADSLTLSLNRRFCCTEPFLLKLSTLQLGERLQLELHYDPQYLLPEQVQLLSALLHTLLRHSLVQPQTAIGNLPILPEPEQAYVLDTFCASKTALPQQVFHQLFEEQAERTPYQLAVVGDTGHLTYQELNAQANQLAYVLRQRGVGPNVLVGLCISRSIHMLVSLLAILKAGGAYVPLDPEHPAARLAYQLKQIQSPLLLTQQALLPSLPAWNGQIVCLEAILEELADAPLTNLTTVSRPEDLAYVIYTSGSTGTPKGVMICQQSVVNYTLALCDVLGGEPGWHYATVSTLAADLGNTAIFPALATGGCLQVLGYETITSGEAFARWVAQHPIDVLKIVPSHLSALLASEQAHMMLPQRALVLGGEALPPGLIERLRELKGTCRVFNHYGPTEMTIGVLVNPLGVLKREFDRGQQEEAGTVALGRPIVNTEAYVLSRGLQLMPIGVTGELYLGGAGLAMGYLYQSTQTAERFVPHSFGARAGERLYRTGDLARYTPQGQIEFMGRYDNQVKLHGYRIELGEIEAVLRRHAHVWNAVVLLREDMPGNPRLVGYVVFRDQPTPAIEDLRAFMKEHVPEYMVPSLFVILESLPLTPNGKVDRQQLPEPEQSQGETLTAPASPRNPIEEILLEIWRDLLTLPSVGIHDNFFALGGHSLLVTRLIARVQAVLQVELPLRSLFEAPTIAGLAQRVKQALLDGPSVEAPPFVPVARTQDLPLSFAQQRLWFLDQLEADSTTYLLPRTQRLQGTLDTVALERSLEEMIQRHEILRTTFQVQADQPVQVIHPAALFHLPFIDLRGLKQDERLYEAQRLAEQEAQQPCNLMRGPLLRTYLLWLDADEYVFLWTMHHIITDGWSNDVFGRELSMLYQAFTAGKPSPLPPLPIQYADFAVWQRQWLQGEVLEAQLSYWRRQLAEVPVLQLPTDHPRPPLQTFHGGTQSIRLPASLYEGLLRLSQQEDVTLFMLLLAAFQVLLARYTGQRDISVGTAIANRSRPELEGLLGFFINTLVLRTDLSGNPSFVEVLKRVREVALGAYTHQDVPFEYLVEVLQPERDLSRSPLFQVSFGVQQMSTMVETPEGLQFSGLGLTARHTTTKFDLSFNAVTSASGFHCSVVYNRDLFAAETMQSLLAHWQRLLEGLLAAPQRPVSDLPLLSATERQRVLVDWNATQRNVAPQACLSTLVEAQAARTPDALAIVTTEGSLSYGALSRLTGQFATYLLAWGLRPHTAVALCMERGLAGAISLLGVLKATGIYVPLDPEAPSQRLTSMLAETQASIVLTQQHLCERLPQTAARLLVFEQQWASVLQQPPLATPSPREQEAAYVLYTSGSTGRPKGVLMPHAAIVNRVGWGIQEVGLQATDRLGQVASWSFDIALWELFGPWLVGAAVVVLTQEEVKASWRLVERVREEQLTVLHLVPSLLSVVVQEPGLAACQSVRCVQSGGEVVRRELVRELWDRLPVEVQQYYGPTEAAISVTSWRGTPAEGVEELSLGWPIANTQVYVVDAAWQLVVPGVWGEIWIGGAGLAWGYVQQGEQTAERFVPDVWSGGWGKRLYRTGDVGRQRHDGRLEYGGRWDGQVKLRGYRIELAEIEAALVAQAGVRESVVLLAEQRWGEPGLVGYVVGAEGALTGAGWEEQLREGLQKQLPGYMVPARLVRVEALPLLTNGKIDRRTLVSREQPMKEEEESEEVVARTPLEELLTQVWSEVLGGGPVGIHDDFFASGGHSLLATRLVARMQSMLQVEIGVQTLFEAPTIAELAQQVEQALRGKQRMEVPSLMSVPRMGDIPLSFAQQRLWFLDQLEPESTVYLIPGVRRLHGALNAEALERSLTELVRRHESLRTSFQVRADQPVQIIHPADVFRLPVISLERLDRKERTSQTRQLASQETGCPFNLAQGPLMRSYLLRLDAAEHVLLITMHHIISDGWSNEVLMRELTILYRAMVAREPSPLPPLPIQYADFAIWQRQWLQGAVLDEQMGYWRHQLLGAPQLELPTDHPRPPLQTFRGAYQVAHLPIALHEELVALSRRESVTLFMLLLAAFQVLLARYSGQHDISIGTPIANRTRSELEGLIGFFVNTLVLRTNLSGNPAFVEVLRRVREVTLGAYAHQDVPFEHLVEALQPQRDLSRSPLFQVMFVIQQPSATTVPQRERQEDVSFSDLGDEYSTTKFDLTLTAVSSIEGLLCEVEYNRDLFEASTIQRLLTYWQILLEGIVACPQTCLIDLPLLTSAERQLILYGWNDTQVELPADLCIQDLFEAQSARSPEAIAVVSGEQHLSYAALNQRSSQLAQYLRVQGIKPETPVGVCVQRSVELVIALLGVLKAGGAYVPLDPTYPSERLAFILEDACVPVLLTQQHIVATLPAHHAQVVCLDADWAALSAESKIDMAHYVGTQNLAYIIYTSGSTGRPKGVLISHRAIMNHCTAVIQYYNFGSLDRVLQFASPSFDVAAEEIFPTLLQGATLIFRTDEALVSFTDFLHFIEKEQVTILNLPAAYWHGWVTELPNSHRLLPSALRLVIVGSEKVLLERLTTWRKYVDERVRWSNAYGPTEATITTTIYEPKSTDLETLSVPIGRPIANTRVYVLDRFLQPTPIKVSGELYIGGAGVARGYHQRAELTAAYFLPDPFSEIPGARMYRTGDSVRYLSSGDLEFIGRNDLQIKLRGYRIELAEIEAILLTYPLVRESLVRMHENAAGDKHLVAYIVGSQPGMQLSSGELRRYLQKHLPDYMVPAFFVTLEALPLTPGGKVDQQLLPPPQMSSSELCLADGVARTPIEELLREIWCEVLGRSQVGIGDNFFELGGHSLLATRLISRVRTVVQVEVPLRSLFEAPTIAELGRIVEQLLRDGQNYEVPALVPMARTSDVPLSFAQQRLWFLDQLDPGSTIYMMPSAQRVCGALDTAVLERSLEEMIRRHESLRTTFDVRAGQPMQVIHPPGVFRLPLVDLRGLAPSEREPEVRRLVTHEVQQPCSLAHGPLMRVSLLYVEHEEYVLLLTLHHIITDGWSNDLFVRELTTLYRALSRGESNPLPPLPIQYADFALWQRSWLHGEVLARQLAYWKQQLADVPVLELPTDFARPPRQTFRGAHQVSFLPSTLRGELLVLAQREGVTLFMLLLAAFQVLLSRYSGQKDISIGTALANRTRSELEELIGFFVNTLVLRTKLAGDPSFVEVLRRVKEVALGAYAHQDVPFEYLVEMLHPQRDLSRTPLFQVSFGVQQLSQAAETLEGLMWSGLSTDHTVTKFDLTFNILSSVQGLRCGVEYNIDLFEASTIQALLEHWHILLQGIVAAPLQRVASLPLLSVGERQHLLRQGNAPTHPLPAQPSFPCLFAQQVACTPDALAVCSDETSLSYAYLDRCANQLAHYLHTLEVGPEVLVGVLVERSAAWLICLLAVLKAGGGYVPLDASTPPVRMQGMLTDANVTLLMRGHDAPVLELPPPIRSVGLTEAWSQVIQQPPYEPTTSLLEEQVAYVIFTSGSTGRPKGVLVPHRGLGNLARAQSAAFGVNSGSRVLQFAAPNFDASLAEIVVTLLAGACLVLAPPERILVGVDLLRLLEEQAVTVLTLPPSVLAVLPLAPLPALASLIVAGEACPAELLTRWAEGRHCYNAYGPTETTVCASISTDVERGRQWAGSCIGRPLTQIQCYVLDEQGEMLPTGAVGELCIAGVGVARGYLGRADLTAEHFVPHQWSTQPGERLYKTGDRVRYREEGQMEYVGRQDQQVKVRGYRIELGELEAILATHEAVRQAVVVGSREEGVNEVLAYVVSERGPRLSSELRSYLQERVPDYMLPSRMVVLAALPLLSNGKVDRRALAVTERESDELSDEQDAPRTLVEEQLANMWRELLKREQVGIHDDFFELGGHSLLATQLISRIQSALQVEVSVQALFEYTTIAELAVVIEQKQAVLIHQTASEDLAQLVAALEALSDEEIHTALTTEI